MARIYFKKNPRKLEHFNRCSISIPIGALGAVQKNDTVVVEIYSGGLSKENQRNLPYKKVIELTGEYFIHNAINMGQYYVIHCQD